MIKKVTQPFNLAAQSFHQIKGSAIHHPYFLGFAGLLGTTVELDTTTTFLSCLGFFASLFLFS
jgi:hypothetical protein